MANIINFGYLNQIELELRMLPEVLSLGVDLSQNSVKLSVLSSSTDNQDLKNLVLSICKRYLDNPIEVEIKSLDIKQTSALRAPKLKRPPIEPEKIELENNELLVRVSY